MTAEYTRHLWAASHALATTSPAISAHLMTRLLKLSSSKPGFDHFETKIRNHACTACGTITIPGLNCHVHTSNNHKRKRKPSNTPNAAVKQKDTTPERPHGYRAHGEASNLRMIYECRTCGRSTTHEVPPAKRKSSNRVRSRFTCKGPGSFPTADVSSSSATANTRASPTFSAPMPSQNAGSKRRARSRKGNSLSEILAAKKKQDSSRGGGRGNGVGGFGLSLMDLMKTG